MASSTSESAVFDARAVRCAVGVNGGEVGLDGGETLSEFVVQFVREAARGGFLIFQQLPGDAAQFGGLRFETLDQLHGHAHGDHGEDQRQQYAAAGEDGGPAEQIRNLGGDVALRGAELAVFRVDQLGYHGGEIFVVAKEFGGRKGLWPIHGEDAAGFVGELFRRLLQMLPQRLFGRLLAFARDTLDVAIGSLEFLEDLGVVEGVRIARHVREDIGEGGLLAAQFADEPAGDSFFIEQGLGIPGDRLDAVNTHDGRG